MCCEKKESCLEFPSFPHSAGHCSTRTLQLCLDVFFSFFLFFPPASLTSSKTRVSGHPADFWLPTQSGSHDNTLMLTLNRTWEFSSRRGRDRVSGVCAFLSCCGRCVRDCVCLCCVHVCAAVSLTFLLCLHGSLKKPYLLFTCQSNYLDIFKTQTESNWQVIHQLRW